MQRKGTAGGKHAVKESAVKQAQSAWGTTKTENEADDGDDTLGTVDVAMEESETMQVLAHELVSNGEPRQCQSITSSSGFKISGRRLVRSNRGGQN